MSLSRSRSNIRLTAAWVTISLISFWLFFLPALMPDSKWIGPPSHTLGSSVWQSEKLQYSDWTFWGSTIFWIYGIIQLYLLGRDRFKIFPVPKGLNEIDPEFL